MITIRRAFAGILAGLITLATATSQADAGQHPIPPRMVNAVIECAPAPKSAERLCEALWLRPRTPHTLAGKAEVEECFTTASEEHRPHSRGWNRYVRRCMVSATATPGQTG